MKSRIYEIPDSKQKIILTSEVIEVLNRYIQMGDASEAGGILFAEFNLPIIKIVEASIPNPSDRRWITLFIPDRILQRKLIRKQFKKGYHFVGEWHTHPFENPSPSGLDVESSKESYIKSKHELNYFIMIIVGNSAANFNLWVSIHDGTKWCKIYKYKYI